jgi:hypothetical protein
MVGELPTQFNEATNRTIELIDVLWLKGNSIVAAFEVECTTAIYSGLLRMSDLLALQPNLEINLFLVAPDERQDKVEQEILRPTFALREKPLAKVCGFIGFTGSWKNSMASASWAWPPRSNRTSSKTPPNILLKMKRIRSRGRSAKPNDAKNGFRRHQFSAKPKVLRRYRGGQLKGFITVGDAILFLRLLQAEFLCSVDAV